VSISCDCSIDHGEYAEFYREEFPVARKPYKCCECGETIKRGQKYNKVTACWDGRFSTYRTCMPCKSIRDKYCPNGFIFELLRETISECLGFDYTEVPEDDGDAS